ncbi:uncharacterized protein Hap1MRO34_004542 isoform 1-T2 [Clarias gariepinus]
MNRHKKPVSAGPTKTYIRGKLGESIFKKDPEFNATGSSMQLNNQYNSLHDPCLKPFLHHPERKKQLKKMGLITKDDKVLCSRSEFTQCMNYRSAVQKSRDKHSHQEVTKTTKMDSSKKNPISDASPALFTRGKLGESIFKKDPEFDVTSSNIKLNHQYSCLHDPYLKPFLHHPERKKHLKKMGLITGDDQVLCSRSEFMQCMNYRSAVQKSREKHFLQEVISQNKTAKMDSSKKNPVSAAPSVLYTRGKLGDSIFKKDPEFDPTGTNMRLNNEYNCLHDPHLRSFFHHPERKKLLKKIGLITVDDQVLCSRPEFMQYLNYRSAVQKSCEKHSLQEEDRSQLHYSSYRLQSIYR